MMGERRAMQEALFYGFSLSRQSPASQGRPVRRPFGGSNASGAVLQRDGSPFGRSRADDPHADRRPLHGHPVRAAPLRRGPPQSGVPLASLGGHGLSTPLVSAGQVGSARKGSGFFACSTPGGVGGQDGLRRIGRPSSATRPVGKCRTVATSD